VPQHQDQKRHPDKIETPEKKKEKKKKKQSAGMEACQHTNTLHTPSHGS
jgi:hypothetical protein